MLTKAAIVILTVFSLTTTDVHGQANGDPCDPQNHVELNEPFRSTGHALSDKEYPLCDKDLKSGWYRFTSQAGSEMPTECPQDRHCGTLVPLWMKGLHPATWDGIVQRDACGNYVSHGDCCDHSFKISVKNCDNNFYVYLLQPARSCPVSYCAGTKAPCPFGKWSPTMFPPCKDAFPVLTTPPVLTGPNIRDNKAFDFVCKITYAPQDPDQVFEVVWTFDGEENPAVPAKTLTGTEREATLEGLAITGFSDKNVGCRVRSYFIGNEKVKSDFLASNTHFAGIQISPPKLVISERDQESTITLTSTVPILCNHDFECCLTYSLDVDATTEVTIDTACEYKLCSADWDPVLKQASIKVRVMARQDMINDGAKKVLLTFEKLLPAGAGEYMDIFFHHQDQIQVEVKDEATSTCAITGDPHITGFDYKRQYHLFLPGDFVAYEVPRKLFQIHIRTWLCVKRVYCVCGVVIRERNDVIRIDQCDQPYDGRHTSPVIEAVRELSEGIVIQRSVNGKNIGVYLSSGVEVKIDAYPRYMNVYITTPGLHRGLGRGICGTNDGNSANDFTYPDGKQDLACFCGLYQFSWFHTLICSNCIPNDFLLSWRIEGTRSLFEHTPDPVTDEKKVQYCTCKKNKIGDPVVDCSSRKNVPGTGTACPKNCKTVKAKINPRTVKGKKRSVVYEDIDEPDVQYQPEEKTSTTDFNITWSDNPVITKAKALELCNNAMKKSPLYSKCGTAQELSEMSMDNCMADILHGRTTEFLDSITSALTDSCQITEAKDPANYVMASDGQQVLKSELLQDVCDLECEVHGHCGKGGQCDCDDGWEGVNCQIMSGKGPQIDKIRSGQFCDLAVRPCRTIFTDVSNIELSTDLICRIRTITELGTHSRVSETSAEYLSAFRIACTLPETSTSSQRYNISVSNDGTLFGNELSLHVFDSTCLDCDAEGCAHKSAACHIDNICYRNGTENKLDKYKICDVGRNTTEWTILPRENNGDRCSGTYLLIIMLEIFVCLFQMKM